LINTSHIFSSIGPQSALRRDNKSSETVALRQNDITFVNTVTPHLRAGTQASLFLLISLPISFIEKICRFRFREALDIVINAGISLLRLPITLGSLLTLTVCYGVGMRAFAFKISNNINDKIYTLDRQNFIDKYTANKNINVADQVGNLFCSPFYILISGDGFFSKCRDIATTNQLGIFKKTLLLGMRCWLGVQHMFYNMIWMPIQSLCKISAGCAELFLTRIDDKLSNISDDLSTRVDSML